MTESQINHQDLRKQFYHELLQPYQRLVRRVAQNDLVGTGISDITNDSNALAVLASHFIESKKLPSDRDDNLREKLKDVGDSAKHGQLNNVDRTVTLSTSLAYEIDDTKGARFLRTEVLASNNRFGAFDLVETLGLYISKINTRFQLGFENIEPSIALGSFSGEAEVRITPNTADVKSMNIRTYKRDASGSLILADPGKFTFVVVK